MAFVGLMYSLFAPIEQEIDGQPVKYKADAAVEVGQMIGADITFNRDSNSLYANDAEAESDNSITGGTLTINVDDIEEDAEVVILGTKMKTEEDLKIYQEIGSPSPYGGFGYVRVRRKKGVTSYQALWIHKTQLGIATESAATKGQSISWQTPSLTGPIMAVRNDPDMENHFRDKVVFKTAAEAIAWVQKRGGYTPKAA